MVIFNSYVKLPEGSTLASCSWFFWCQVAGPLPLLKRPWLSLWDVCHWLCRSTCRWNHGSNLVFYLQGSSNQTIPFSTLSSLAVFWGVDNGNLYMTTRTTNSKPTLLVELGSSEIFDTRNYTIHTPSGRTIHPFWHVSWLWCRCCGHWRAGGMRSGDQQIPMAMWQNQQFQYLDALVNHRISCNRVIVWFPHSNWGTLIETVVVLFQSCDFFIAMLIAMLVEHRVRIQRQSTINQ